MLVDCEFHTCFTQNRTFFSSISLKHFKMTLLPLLLCEAFLERTSVIISIGSFKYFTPVETQMPFKYRNCSSSVIFFPVLSRQYW